MFFEINGVEVKYVYECDPEKNVECKKETCFVNGGACEMTHQLEYAKAFSKTYTIIPRAMHESDIEK